MPDLIDLKAAFDAVAGATPSESSITVGGQGMRLVAFDGVGGWHKHDTAEETVICWSGQFHVEYRDRTVVLGAGQACVIKRGAEHRGSSPQGARIVLLRQVAA